MWRHTSFRWFRLNIRRLFHLYHFECFLNLAVFVSAANKLSKISKNSISDHSEAALCGLRNFIFSDKSEFGKWIRVWVSFRVVETLLTQTLIPVAVRWDWREKSPRVSVIFVWRLRRALSLPRSQVKNTQLQDRRTLLLYAWLHLSAVVSSLVACLLSISLNHFLIFQSYLEEFDDAKALFYDVLVPAVICLAQRYGKKLESSRYVCLICHSTLSEIAFLNDNFSRSKFFHELYVCLPLSQQRERSLFFFAIWKLSSFSLLFTMTSEFLETLRMRVRQIVNKPRCMSVWLMCTKEY